MSQQGLSGSLIVDKITLCMSLRLQLEISACSSRSIVFVLYNVCR